MIKTIVFDFSGVIAYGFISGWVKNNLASGDPRITYIKQSSHAWDIGEISLEETYRRIAHVTDVPPEKIWETFFENTKAEKDIVEIIKQLKKHYKIILFSNYLGELLRKLLDKHEITDLFDEILISSEHKTKKPYKEFFELLTKVSGVKKDEMIFIDDTEENVVASNAFGIKAFIYTESKMLLTDLRSAGVKI